MSELQSDEARTIRQALNSLGHQQMETLGSIDGLRRKAEDHQKENREQFRSVCQQIGTINKSLGEIGERVAAIGEVATGTREIVESMRKVLHELRIAPPGTVLAPQAEVSFDAFERTPHGGVHLNERDQAILTQRLAKLEEDRRIADAVAKERGEIIAAQKREAEEKRLVEEKRLADEKETEKSDDELALKKSQERRAWLAAYVAAGVAAGGGIVWLVQTLTHVVR